MNKNKHLTNFLILSFLDKCGFMNCLKEQLRTNLYNNSQLIVIIVLSSCLFFLSTAETVSVNDADVVFEARPGFVYDVGGNVIKEGIYCFEEEQTLGVLLSECRGMQKGAVFEGDPSIRVQSGSKIIFGEDVTIGQMDAHARLNYFLPLSINSSTADELAFIRGIGPGTAHAIVAYRDMNNGIDDLRSLTDIKGIGEKKLQSLLPYLTVEE
jgi:competence protein ComEA